MISNRKREVAKQLCIFALKYSVVLSTLAIVFFCAMAMFYKHDMVLLEFTIDMGPLWFISLLCSSYYLAFCPLHRALLLYTFIADMVFNKYTWLGIDNIRFTLYAFLISGTFLLFRVFIKIRQKCKQKREA